MTDLAGRPFYDARPDPAGGTAAWTLDDLCDFAAAAGDPYGGRLDGGPFGAAPDNVDTDTVDAARLPPFSLQLEAGEPPVWVGLDADELGRWATALERLLARCRPRARSRCPWDASSFKTGSAQKYYPGDDVVDWICADGYNFAPDSSYREFEPIFAAFYAWASQRPKPLMIAEYGSQSAGPGQRAAWLDAAHAALVQKFPRILAVVYFHSNSEHDWTLYDEPGALAAFRRMAVDPYFNPPPIYPRR